MISNKQNPNRTVTLALEDWGVWRRAAGLLIDPETAEVLWDYTQVLDPYGVFQDIPAECDCVGRSYFARAPGPAGLDLGFMYFSKQYLEQNFGASSDLSDDEFDKAMWAAHEAYLAHLQQEARGDQEDRTKS